MATKTLKTAALHQPEVPKGNASSAVAPSKDDCGDVESKVTAGAPTDTLKKKRRAERFGMPVLLSEQEKRNCRAERFGTVSGDLLKKSEEHKRKARAERFGLEKSVLVAEEEKKKARLARFAPVLKTNPLEEEKKKARALRFSEKSSSMPQSNVTGIEPPLQARQVKSLESELSFKVSV